MDDFSNLLSKMNKSSYHKITVTLRVINSLRFIEILKQRWGKAHMSFKNLQSNLGSARLQNRKVDEQRLGVRPNEINLQTD